MEICKHCGNLLTVEQSKLQEAATAKEYTYTVEGVKFKGKLIPRNDAFFEVVSGRHKGNLIHTFNVIKG